MDERLNLKSELELEYRTGIRRDEIVKPQETFILSFSGPSEPLSLVSHTVYPVHIHYN